MTETPNAHSRQIREINKRFVQAPASQRSEEVRLQKNGYTLYRSKLIGTKPLRHQTYWVREYENPGHAVLVNPDGTTIRYKDLDRLSYQLDQTLAGEARN